MTYQATGYVRDYSSASDTATVELIGIGIIDAWLDGIAINAGVNRGYLTHGALVILSIPDAHRLCEAVIVSISSSDTVISQSGGPQSSQTGRTKITTDAFGAGSVTVTFSPAFTSTPIVYAGADDILPLHIGTPTTTAITFSLSAGTAPANTTVYITWYALGGS